MAELQKGSTRDIVNNIYTILRRDEELLRLLHYPPEDVNTGQPDPLHESLPDIFNSPIHSDILDKVLLPATKSSNIEKDAICRVYIYMGRRRPVFNSYLLATQEVVIDVFVSEKFDKDMRLAWICDRISKLIALECIEGSLRKLEYVAGNSRMAPLGYSKYENIYEYLDGKK